jgi:protein TonB
MVMTNEKQYVESLEELVFENRNKEYGSYQLRKKYKKYVLTALAIALFLFGIVIAYPLIKSILAQGKLGKLTQTETSVELINPNETPPPPPPPPPPEKLIQ